METKDPILSRGLDYYKPTMSQLAFEKKPGTEVAFTFKNRNHELLSDFVTPEELRNRFEEIRRQGFQPEEIAYLAGLQAQDGTARFTPEYLDHLADMELPEVKVDLDETTGDIAISTTGEWSDVSFWETVVMSELNEQYYIHKMAQESLSIEDLYAEGDKRLSHKIEILRSRPDIKIADFGTRRRFSAHWHEHVIERLINECPDNFVGTSNVWFAYKFGVPPIGTFAHEMPMVYSALQDAAGHDPLDGHGEMLRDWYEYYGEDLSTALTDTFGSEFFFTDFTLEQAAAWKGLRHDSGDPFEFGERVIEFYESYGIDPLTKTLVFSDGLDIDSIVELADHFGGRIKLVFGWGTTLTNDLGLPANNFVMKATEANGMPTVKRSDNIGKHTGPEYKIQQYEAGVERRVGHSAARELVGVA